MTKCEKCGQGVPERKKTAIRSRHDSDRIIHESDMETVRKAVEEAVKKGVSLDGAYLRHADLRHADLRYAELRGADLRNANLRNADLSEADLRGADLRYAELRGASLSGVNTANCTVNFIPDEYEQAKQFIEGLKN